MALMAGGGQNSDCSSGVTMGVETGAAGGDLLCMHAGVRGSSGSMYEERARPQKKTIICEMAWLTGAHNTWQPSPTSTLLGEV